MPPDFQSGNCGFESRRPHINFEFGIGDLGFKIRNHKSQIPNRIAGIAKSGLRRWSAKPIIVGSNPTARSNLIQLSDNSYQLSKH